MTSYLVQSLAKVRRKKNGLESCFSHTNSMGFVLKRLPPSRRRSFCDVLLSAYKSSLLFAMHRATHRVIHTVSSGSGVEDKSSSSFGTKDFHRWVTACFRRGSANFSAEEGAEGAQRRSGKECGRMVVRC